MCLTCVSGGQRFDKVSLDPPSHAAHTVDKINAASNGMSIDVSSSLPLPPPPPLPPPSSPAGTTVFTIYVSAYCRDRSSPYMCALANFFFYTHVDSFVLCIVEVRLEL
jgi:hypothetical protein